MLEGRIIICLGSSWDYDPTSKHQIMKLLAERNDVIWVNYHGTRRPTVSKADLGASFATLRRVARGVQAVNSSMVQVTPLVIPGARGRVLEAVHERLLVGQIRRVLRQVDGGRNRPVQVWSFAPDVPFLAGRFDEECFVYYCVDEFSEFEGFDRARILSAERELLDRADVVIASSQTLWENKRLVRPDAHLVRHGVDFDHFARAWRQPLPRPSDLLDVPDPIFGFFGLVHYWIDCALLARVARLRPEYSFVLLGDVRVDVSELDALPNVHLLGRKPYQELPAYCRAFTAGMLLFTPSTMTANVNPIKMREYLAAGLQVISTPLPEAELYRGPIRIVSSADQFARACDEMRSGGHLGRREEIARRVQQESWAAVVERLSTIVKQKGVRMNFGAASSGAEGEVQAQAVRNLLPRQDASDSGSATMPQACYER